MRVLALQLKRIGDLLLTLPALRALREGGAHVTLVLAPAAEGLLPALAESVNEAFVYRPHRLNAALWRRLARGGFDACLDFTGRERSALLTLASRAGRRIIARDALRGRGAWRKGCYHAPVDASVRLLHTVDYYLAHLAPLGVFPAPAGPLLRLPEAARAAARALVPGEYAVMHPGSARREKYWEAERWAAVIDFCQGTLGLPCVLTGGRGDPVEDQHLAAIRAALTQPCRDLAGQLDLATLAAVLAHARLFAGVDSGPMHLAAAAGVPQVALFGPTNPFHWRPRGPGTLVLAGEGGPRPAFSPHDPGQPMNGISTPAVIDAIKQLAQEQTAPRGAG